MTSLHNPRTIAEALTILLGSLSVDQKATIRQQSRDEFVNGGHIGLGLWIRNSMIHRNPFKEHLEHDFMRVNGDLDLNGVPQADAISGGLLGMVWDEQQKGILD